ncbi:hypothetical protein T01_8494 [Trichinella spiralis]|uniref:Uncharacterized protein n=1 Tax=Trichinella spiralis TaxID=6334 RepID=A0A0V1AK72_TRISP|nr:hypothetical protein T01_8494 [Trichinella spiralis]
MTVTRKKTVKFDDIRGIQQGTTRWLLPLSMLTEKDSAPSNYAFRLTTNKDAWNFHVRHKELKKSTSHTVVDLWPKTNSYVAYSITEYESCLVRVEEKPLAEMTKSAR